MFVKREIETQFDKVKPVYNILALVGARQSGKTTFLKEKMKPINASYILFDDPDAKNLFEQDIKKFEHQYISGFDTAVLDEVHYCKEAGTKLKYLADKGKKLWITSSSEIILGKEILSFLVGRVSVIKLFPFSFLEFLRAKGVKELTPLSLERNTWEHLTYGGYPKAVLAKTPEIKKTILRDLYSTMILKDIAQTFSIKEIGKLEDFSKYLAINTSNIISYEKASNEMQISFQTLKKYLHAMEKSYLITRITPFYSNKTKEITKQPKIYFIDTGLRNAITKTYSQEPDGKIFENYALTELIKAGFQPKYWRTKSKAEVDFVIEKDNETIPIEIKINTKIGKIEKSLKSFIKKYNPKTTLITTLKGPNATIKKHNCTIHYTNIKEMNTLLKQKQGT